MDLLIENNLHIMTITRYYETWVSNIEEVINVCKGKNKIIQPIVDNISEELPVWVYKFVKYNKMSNPSYLLIDVINTFIKESNNILQTSYIAHNKVLRDCFADTINTKLRILWSELCKLNRQYKKIQNSVQYNLCEWIETYEKDIEQYQKKVNLLSNTVNALDKGYIIDSLIELIQDSRLSEGHAYIVYFKHQDKLTEIYDSSQYSSYEEYIEKNCLDIKLSNLWNILSDIFTYKQRLTDFYSYNIYLYNLQLIIKNNICY
jgi:hypothetical protein